METDKALWGSVFLFAVAFGFPAITIWLAHLSHLKHHGISLKPGERKNNVGEKAKTG